jgi:hypothetical protein
MKIRTTPYLTTVDASLDQRVRDTHVGMASWAGSGPANATCGDCKHYGYWRRIRNAAGDVVSTEKASGCCAEFHRLSGRHGPRVPRDALACAYFNPADSITGADRGGFTTRAGNGDTEMDMRPYGGSRFLKHEDVVEGPLRKKIMKIAPGKYSPVATFDDEDQLSLNVTNTNALAKAYGWNSDSWIGHTVELYAGTTIYQGQERASVLVRPLTAATEAPTPLKPRSDDLNDEIPF